MLSIDDPVYAEIVVHATDPACEEVMCRSRSYQIPWPRWDSWLADTRLNIQ
ncbi:hypothetical protein [[Mycobacterium] zoologicum]|jgi:hypothetical protein|uniref:hypothetical protein n=1 Tax=[Mycobacterium] zoologicum TaxID=2872311 RepID=UPI001CDB43DE|nr:hypothetical protein [Mycolicibacter sp. MYC101]MEB3062741.1 hypothetical protein [Mycolicibacter sp. MYC101]